MLDVHPAKKVSRIVHQERERETIDHSNKSQMRSVFVLLIGLYKMARDVVIKLVVTYVLSADTFYGRCTRQIWRKNSTVL